MWALFLLFTLPQAETFSVTPFVTSTARYTAPQIDKHQACRPTSLTACLPTTDIPSSSLAWVPETWRDYFAVFLVSGVAVDALMGSPLVNLLLEPLRETTPEPPSEEKPRYSGGALIDCDQVAQDALRAAKGALDKHRAQEEQRTNWYDIQDASRKNAQDLKDLEERMDAQQKRWNKLQTTQNDTKSFQQTTQDIHDIREDLKAQKERLDEFLRDRQTAASEGEVDGRIYRDCLDLEVTPRDKEVSRNSEVADS